MKFYEKMENNVEDEVLTEAQEISGNELDDTFDLPESRLKS